MVSFGNQITSKTYDTMWGLASDAILGKIKDAAKQKKIKEKLEKYLSKELDKNFHVSHEEEIDFEGLANYIRGDLLEDVETCLFGQTQERKFAREKILEKAAMYAKGNTEISTTRAQKMVSDVIEILKKFCHKQVSKDLRRMSGEITDDIIQSTTEQFQQLSREIQEAKQTIDSTTIMSLDQNISLLKNGDVRAVEENINSFAKVISTEHPLPDYFRYDIWPIGNQSMIVSVPITPKACELYPPKIKGVADFKIEGVDKKLWEYNIVDYANRHQLNITMTVKDAEKVLGKIKDPSQVEAEAMKGKDYIILPKPFPPAFPCSIVGDGKTIINYLLLRTMDISDDGVYTVTNDEQRSRKFKFTFKFNIKTHKMNFNFSAIGFGNQGRLAILKVKKDLMQCMEFKIYLLEQNRELMCGKFDASNCSEIRSVEEDISIFERVLKIEQYFKAELNVPDMVTVQEIEYLKYISELICGGICEFDWNQFVCNLDVDEKIKKTIFDSSGKEYTIQRDGTIEIELWGSKFKLPIRRLYVCATILNYERTKEKLQVLDIGDSLKVTFIPGSGGNSVKDRLRSS